MNPEGGEEKTIKDHAWHELLTTALAVASSPSTRPPFDMSAPNASSSSSQLVSYAQDIDYTRTEGFKQFKMRYNVKNVRAARNDPNGVYPLAETIYQAIKGPGCTLWSFDSLSLDDFISAGAVAARHRLKRLSLVLSSL